MKNSKFNDNESQPDKLESLTFEQLPLAVSLLIDEVKGLKTILLTADTKDEPTDRWFNLQELCEYLPDHPARQTVYGWVSQHLIPYHKKGKKLQLLQSEIDAWLKSDEHKTTAQLQAEAQQFINSKSQERRAI